MNIETGSYHTLSQTALWVPPGMDVLEFVNDMWATLARTNGVGLAANQVGVLQRVIIVDTPHFRSEIINPVLSNGRFEKQSKEGCLSFPGRKEVVKRFNRITVTGFDRNWKPITKNLKALSAFVVQHEVDHLNGTTI